MFLLKEHDGCLGTGAQRAICGEAGVLKSIEGILDPFDVIRSTMIEFFIFEFTDKFSVKFVCKPT